MTHTDRKEQRGSINRSASMLLSPNSCSSSFLSPLLSSALTYVWLRMPILFEPLFRFLCARTNGGRVGQLSTTLELSAGLANLVTPQVATHG